MERHEQQKKDMHLLTDKKVYVHLPAHQYEVLANLLSATRFQTIGELLRHILAGKTVVARYYDDSPDHLLEAISVMQMDLEVYAVSIRRLARNLYTIQHPETRLSSTEAAVSIYQEVGELIEELNVRVRELAKRWISV